MTSHSEHRLTEAELDTIVCTLAADCVLDEASAVLLFREIKAQRIELDALRGELHAAHLRRETAERLVSVEREGHERVRAALEAIAEGITRHGVDVFVLDPSSQGDTNGLFRRQLLASQLIREALADLPPAPVSPLDCQGRPYPDLQASPDSLATAEEDPPCPSCGEGRDKHITICTKYSQMVPVPNVDAAPGGMPVNLTFLARGIQMPTMAPIKGPATHPFVPMSGSQDTSGVYQRCSVIGCTVAPDQHVPMPSQAPDAARSDG